MVESVVIRNGIVVNATGVSTEQQDVVIVDGKISKIVPSSPSNSYEESFNVIDADGKLIIPGGIDPHTHMQLPVSGTVAIDDFYSGSRAAICGGTTFFIDFCTPNRGQSMLEAVDTWKSWGEASCCDYSLHLTVVEWNERVNAEMAEAVKQHGISSIKHYLAYPAIMVKTDELACSFRRCQELGSAGRNILPMVHCENGELVLQGQADMLKAGVTGPEGHPQSRKPIVEEEAVNRSITAARFSECPVYIVHNTCKESVDAIGAAKGAGLPIFGEACGPHLSLTDEVYYDNDWERAAGCVLSPPLRKQNDIDALWEALAKDTLSTTASDNCTFCMEQKKAGKDDFTKIPNGLNGVEDRMSVVWQEGVVKRKWTFDRFVAITSTNSAKLFGAFPQKGAVLEGSDADLVIWDPAVSRTISAKVHKQKTDFNAWEGKEINGVPVMTIVGGKVAWKAHVKDNVSDWSKGEFLLEKGAGNYRGRQAFGAAYDNAFSHDEAVKVQR